MAQRAVAATTRQDVPPRACSCGVQRRGRRGGSPRSNVAPAGTRLSGSRIQLRACPESPDAGVRRGRPRSVRTRRARTDGGRGCSRRRGRNSHPFRPSQATALGCERQHFRWFGRQCPSSARASRNNPPRPFRAIHSVQNRPCGLGRVPANLDGRRSGLRFVNAD